MDTLTITGILITLAAAFAWINHKVLKLPTTIGLMVLALLHAGLILVLKLLKPDWAAPAVDLVASIDFNRTVMHGMLGYLLFAGAMHVDLGKLKAQTPIIALLASLGVLITTGLVGGAAYGVTQLFGFDIPFLYCLIFGSLTAPTDPIAVLAIMKKVGAPKTIETQLAGESLFNDGVGVVVFLALMSIAGLNTHQPPEDEASRDHRETAGMVSHEHVGTEHQTDESSHASHDETLPGAGAETDWTDQAESIGKLFAMEAGGGIVLGLAIGLIMLVLLRFIDDYKTEVLITLAGVSGGYALATALHFSGPLAMVIAGLLIGNTGRALAMSPKTTEHLDTFWELIDEILNAVLFVLIGLEVLVLSLDGKTLLAGAIMIPLTLLARFVTVGGAVQLLKPFFKPGPGTIRVLTWAGLRGGISIALALSLKAALPAAHSATGDLLLTMAYVVVAFSIVGQGLTVAPLIRGLGLSLGDDPSKASATAH